MIFGSFRPLTRLLQQSRTYRRAVHKYHGRRKGCEDIQDWRPVSLERGRSVGVHRANRQSGEASRFPYRAWRDRVSRAPS